MSVVSKMEGKHGDGPVQPLLSILIPTFNRAECLDFNLSSLVIQIDDSLLNKIEVIVANNFSSDRTDDILKKYEKYPFLRIIKNNSNVGADLNFKKLVDQSCGRFAWLFGDDEVLFENGLKKIMEILTDHPDAGLIHLTYVGHTSLESFNKKGASSALTPNVFFQSDLFLEKVSLNLSFITANIFNRNYIQSKQATEEFKNSNLIQQTYYLQAALVANENILVTDHIFSQLMNNSGGYNLYDIFATNQQKVFRYFKQFGLKDKTIRKINIDMLRMFFPTFILMERRVFKKNEDSAPQSESAFLTLYRSFKGYKEFWIFCVPLLLIPVGLREIFFTFLKRLKSILKKGIFQSTLKNEI